MMNGGMNRGMGAAPAMNQQLRANLQQMLAQRMQGMGSPMKMPPQPGGSSMYTGGFMGPGSPDRQMAMMPIGNGAMRQPTNASPFSMWLKQRGGM
jgi:hypothetical protein